MWLRVLFLGHNSASLALPSKQRWREGRRRGVTAPSPRQHAPLVCVIPCEVARGAARGGRELVDRVHLLLRIVEEGAVSHGLEHETPEVVAGDPQGLDLLPLNRFLQLLGRLLIGAHHSQRIHQFYLQGLEVPEERRNLRLHGHLGFQRGHRGHRFHLLRAKRCDVILQRLSPFNRCRVCWGLLAPCAEATCKLLKLVACIRSA
mmetsp:Transcript_42221/g.95342  ORF Transcript_42221/g.95342 Transcript_42221/m.95342 type:complete len:204 (-) Transcript_42221:788-1399(-)